MNKNKGAQQNISLSVALYQHYFKLFRYVINAG